MTTTMTLPDGRLLELSLTGPMDGEVLVFHHGTPGTGAHDRLLLEAASARGLGLVTWSRPGYAGSSRQPGRRVADVAGDLAAVLDELGIRTALVAGWSGGGPHALACAALAADRVSGTLVIAGVAPYPAEGVDWLEGMGEENVEEFTATLAGEAALRAYLDQQRPAMLGLTGSELADALASLVSPADLAVLGSERGRAFAEDLALGLGEAVSTGVDGWLDDDLAFVSPWGFELDEVRGPVHVWHGEEDLMVPVRHGRWLAARLPGTPHLLPGEGHLSVGVARLGDMLDLLVTDAERRA